MEGFLNQARNNRSLYADTRVTIYDLDNKWWMINNWSQDRIQNLDGIIEEWKGLQELEKEFVVKIDDNDSRLKLISAPVDLSDNDETKNQRNELKVLISFSFLVHKKT